MVYRVYPYAWSSEDLLDVDGTYHGALGGDPVEYFYPFEPEPSFGDFRYIGQTYEEGYRISHMLFWFDLGGYLAEDVSSVKLVFPLPSDPADQDAQVEETYYVGLVPNYTLAEVRERGVVPSILAQFTFTPPGSGTLSVTLPLTNILDTSNLALYVQSSGHRNRVRPDPIEGPAASTLFTFKCRDPRLVPSDAPYLEVTMKSSYVEPTSRTYLSTVAQKEIGRVVLGPDPNNYATPFGTVGEVWLGLVGQNGNPPTQEFSATGGYHRLKLSDWDSFDTTIKHRLVSFVDTAVSYGNIAAWGLFAAATGGTPFAWGTVYPAASSSSSTVVALRKFALSIAPLRMNLAPDRFRFELDGEYYRGTGKSLGTVLTGQADLLGVWFWEDGGTTRYGFKLHNQDQTASASSVASTQFEWDNTLGCWKNDTEITIDPPPNTVYFISIHEALSEDPFELDARPILMFRLATPVTAFVLPYKIEVGALKVRIG